MDIATPRNVYLSPFYRRSHAVINYQERMPASLMKVITSLKSQLENLESHLQTDNRYQKQYDELQEAIEKLISLKEEIIADKPFRKLYSTGPDVPFYNYYLDKLASLDCQPSYLQTIRLYSECYMFRRVWEIFEVTKTLNQFDPFKELKIKLYKDAIKSIVKTGKYLNNVLQELRSDDSDTFTNLMKLNMWSNQGDLNMPKEVNSDNERHILDDDQFASFIASNQISEAWMVVSDRDDDSQTIDIVLDNAGYELFMDLCLADFLISKRYAQTVNLHAKYIPWFISDATENDIMWIIKEIQRCSKVYMKELGEKWEKYIKNGQWKVVLRKFWCLPTDFNNMAEDDPWLYRKMGEAKLVILKGDLNYRKAIGEKNWGPETPLTRALENFRPSNLLLIRVAKSDIVCGLDSGKFEEIYSRDKDWLVTGRYGIIQFAKKIISVLDSSGL